MVDLSQYEHRAVLDLKHPKLMPSESKKITEAWSFGYRILITAHTDFYDSAQIEISATRDIWQQGVNITARWQKIRTELEKGEIPDELMEEILKSKEKKNGNHKSTGSNDSK